MEDRKNEKCHGIKMLISIFQFSGAYNPNSSQPKLDPLVLEERLASSRFEPNRYVRLLNPSQII